MRWSSSPNDEELRWNWAILHNSKYKLTQVQPKNARILCFIFGMCFRAPKPPFRDEVERKWTSQIVWVELLNKILEFRKKPVLHLCNRLTERHLPDHKVVYPANFAELLSHTNSRIVHISSSWDVVFLHSTLIKTLGSPVDELRENEVLVANKQYWRYKASEVCSAHAILLTECKQEGFMDNILVTANFNSDAVGDTCSIMPLWALTSIAPWDQDNMYLCSIDPCEQQIQTCRLVRIDIYDMHWSWSTSILDKTSSAISYCAVLLPAGIGSKKNARCWYGPQTLHLEIRLRQAK